MVERIRRILLIEEDEATRKKYEKFLSEHALEFEVESNANNALARLSIGHQFDILLVSILIAKESDWHFMKLVRKKLRLTELHLPIIVISDHFDSGALQAAALSQGANACYSGTQPLSDLFFAIRIHLGQVRSQFHYDA